jgi:hypothetical protein
LASTGYFFQVHGKVSSPLHARLPRRHQHAGRHGLCPAEESRNSVRQRRSRLHGLTHSCVKLARRIFGVSGHSTKEVREEQAFASPAGGGTGIATRSADSRARCSRPSAGQSTETSVQGQILSV